MDPKGSLVLSKINYFSDGSCVKVDVHVESKPIEKWRDVSN